MSSNDVQHISTANRTTGCFGWSRASRCGYDPYQINEVKTYLVTSSDPHHGVVLC